MGVIVAESQVVLDGELDDYYRNVVRPAYSRAEMVLNETAEDPRQLAYVRRRCHDEVRASRSPAVKAALQAYTQRLDVPDVSDDETAWGLAHSLVPVSDWMYRRSAGYPVLSTRGLIDELKKMSEGPMEAPLDNQGDLFHEWCKLQRSERDAYLVAQVDHAAAQWNNAKSGRDVNAEAKETAERAFLQDIACLKTTFNCDPLGASNEEAANKQDAGSGKSGQWTIKFRFDIALRNRHWIRTIQTTSRANRRFVVLLSAAHLVNTEVAGHRYLGLLSLLERQGWTVQAIESGSDLLPFLDARPPHGS